jgi:hypothetical protein
LKKGKREREPAGVVTQLSMWAAIRYENSHPFLFKKTTIEYRNALFLFSFLKLFFFAIVLMRTVTLESKAGNEE